MNTSTAGIPKAGLPEGFVYIDELIEDCIIDAKYAGTDNFMGRPAAGYEQPLVVMSRELADCCIKAADTLRKQGYIARRSGHTRAKAVDLTIVDMHTHQELDMGSIFDYMDSRSNHGAAGLTPQQEKNRAILRDAMLGAGMTLYEGEWWHYNVNPEPYPDTFFNFPIK